MIKCLRWRVLCLLAAGTLALWTSAALSQGPSTVPQKDDGAQTKIVAPTPQQQAKRRAAKLRSELLRPYKRWLQEDVVYIINDEEQGAYKSLNTDQERDRFIEEFWLRRDPTPDTVENEFKEEHYRRIAYANERFASTLPGWKTDRGGIYITYGPPDEIERDVSGACQDPAWPSQSGGQTRPSPIEKWHYRFIYVKGDGMAAEFVFEASTGSGQYHLTRCPPGQRTPTEVAADYNWKSQRTFTGNQGQPFPQSMEEFERLERSIVRSMKPPTVRFPDLVVAADSKSTGSVLPMLARADFFPETSNATLTKITVGFDRADLKFDQTGPASRASVDLYAVVRTTSLRAETVIEDVLTVEVPTELSQQNHYPWNLYQKSVPLAPGSYRLNIVAKDTLSGHINNYEMMLDVPRLEEDRLTASSLVLADLLEHASFEQVRRGQFIIGDWMIRPRMNASFHRDERLGIYLKVYNLGADEKTLKPSGDVTYEIVKAADHSKVMPDFTEDLGGLEGSAFEITITKLLPVRTFEPGKYILRLKIDDNVRKATVTKVAEFWVEP